MKEVLRVNLSIDVPDLEAGLAFYSGVFGMQETSRPFPTMAVIDGGNLAICVHEKAAGTESSPGSGTVRNYERHWTPVHIDFHVSHLRPVLEAISSSGGKVEAEFLDKGPRPVAFCSDPFGNGFCVIAKQV